MCASSDARHLLQRGVLPRDDFQGDLVLAVDEGTRTAQDLFGASPAVAPHAPQLDDELPVGERASRQIASLAHGSISGNASWICPTSGPTIDSRSNAFA